MTKLTIEEKEEIISTISDRVTASLKEPLHNIGIQLKSIQTSLDINLGDLGEDRKYLAQMSIDAATLSQAVKELVTLNHKQTTKIAEKVAEKTEEVINEATNKVAEAVGPEVAQQVRKLNKNAKVPIITWWDRIKLFIKEIKK